MRYRNLAIVWLLIILLAACSSNETSNPIILPEQWTPTNSILGQNTCELPCWQGITPGRTNANELEIITKDWSFAQKIVQATNEQGLGALSWNWKDWPEIVNAGVYYTKPQKFIDIKVNLINRIIINFEKEIALEKIIARYGQPSHILLNHAYDETTKLSYYPWYIVYLEQGFAVSFVPSNQQRPQLPQMSPALAINYLEIFAPSAQGFDIALTDPNLQIDNSSQFLVPWAGFEVGEMYYCRELRPDSIIKGCK
ncbi:hypothetical protein [Herpetosiphon gulosus]|uniref:Uncharacterized protein n=1 Tax=Herpetosiphon gulosus TaxID=1973496 RepID=A0ABP9X655_9CHLR